MLVLAYSSKIKIYWRAACVLLAGFCYGEALFAVLYDKSSLLVWTIPIGVIVGLRHLLKQESSVPARRFLQMQIRLHTWSIPLVWLAIAYCAFDDRWGVADHNIVAAVYNGTLLIEMAFFAGFSLLEIKEGHLIRRLIRFFH